MKKYSRLISLLLAVLLIVSAAMAETQNLSASANEVNTTGTNTTGTNSTGRILRGVFGNYSIGYDWEVGSYTVDLVTDDIYQGRDIDYLVEQLFHVNCADYDAIFKESTYVMIDLNRDDAPDVKVENGKISRLDGADKLTKNYTITYDATNEWTLFSPVTFNVVKDTETKACCVTFDANGGTGTMPAVTVNKGEKYTLPKCEFTAPEGKEFDSWDKGAAGTQIEITTDTVIKAQWKAQETKAFCVIFDANGGTGTMPAVTVNKGEKYTLPKCEFTAPKGKEFDRWDKGAVGDRIEITADTVIKALWKQQIKLTLKKVTVKKNAKKLVLTAKLTVGGKRVKGKKIKFKFNGKIYTAKTNTKGVAKVTIPRSVLSKLKVGKKIMYSATYAKKTVKKTVKVKK